VVQRYGRGLGITLRNLNDALHSARVALQGHATAVSPRDEMPAPPGGPAPQSSPPFVAQAEAPTAAASAGV
jgi:hypothetical protein